MDTDKNENAQNEARHSEKTQSYHHQAYHHQGEPMTPSSHPAREVMGEATVKAYWRANVKLLLTLLAIWFVVSFGAGILFVDQLNQIRLGGFPLGFWFAQQGSIYVFVALIFIYAHRMKALERRFGVDDDA